MTETIGDATLTEDGVTIMLESGGAAWVPGDWVQLRESGPACALREFRLRGFWGMVEIDVALGPRGAEEMHLTLRGFGVDILQCVIANPIEKDARISMRLKAETVPAMVSAKVRAVTAP